MLNRDLLLYIKAKRFRDRLWITNSVDHLFAEKMIDFITYVCINPTIQFIYEHFRCDQLARFSLILDAQGHALETGDFCLQVLDGHRDDLDRVRRSLECLELIQMRNGLVSPIPPTRFNEEPENARLSSLPCWRNRSSIDHTNY